MLGNKEVYSAKDNTSKSTKKISVSLSVCHSMSGQCGIHAVHTFLEQTF